MGFIMYQYTACGLDNVWLKNGYEEHETAQGKGVSIHDIDGLHHAIAHSIAHKSAPLTGKEFRFLRIELDLSQKAVGDLMDKTDQMVAKWEKGENSVPRLADAAIRNYYLESIGDAPISLLLSKLAKLDRQLHEIEIKLEEIEGNGWQEVADCA